MKTETNKVDIESSSDNVSDDSLDNQEMETTKSLKEKVNENKDVKQITLFPANMERFRFGSHLASFQFKDKLNDNDLIANIPETKQWSKHETYKYRDEHGNFSTSTKKQIVIITIIFTIRTVQICMSKYQNLSFFQKT